MSYILKNGKRYYKDDVTGRIELDNVSQEEADRRSRRSRTASGNSERHTSPKTHEPKERTTRQRNTTSKRKNSRLIAVKLVLSFMLIAAVLATVYYHWDNLSETETIFSQNTGNRMDDGNGCLEIDFAQETGVPAKNTAVG